MEYELLLDLTIKLGHRLAMSGAETYRIEESITRILSAYGIQSETFSIPNCLTISIETEDGKPMTRMRRIGYHGNDLDSVERYSNLSRKICAETPEPKEALRWLYEADDAHLDYKLPFYLAGNFLAALGFGIFFGGTLIDGLCAGACGVLVGIINRLMIKQKVNPFFSTLTAALILAVAAYGLGSMHIADNTDMVIIGALMLLMPGLIFTNALRDIIFGDINSGINRIVQVIMIASAVAIGTVTAFKLTSAAWGIPHAGESLLHPYLVQCIAALIGCIGFSILFNIHGPGGLLCALGGFIVWGTYCLVTHYSSDEVLAYFISSAVASIYAESMARIRKFPAISYLVVSIFPLIPGAGIYYSSYYLAHAQVDMAVSKGMETAAFAGAIAIGILMISTIVRHWYILMHKRK